jgi:hypothetical protein
MSKLNEMCCFFYSYYAFFLTKRWWSRSNDPCIIIECIVASKTTFVAYIQHGWTGTDLQYSTIRQVFDSTFWYFRSLIIFIVCVWFWTQIRSDAGLRINFGWKNSAQNRVPDLSAGVNGSARVNESASLLTSPPN